MKTQCPCGASYTVPDKFAGRRVKCKKCGEKFVAGGAVCDATKAKKRKPKKPLTKAEKEEALLNKFSNGSSLEERMNQRERDSIESDRVSNGVTFIIIGVLCVIGAVLLFFGLNHLANNGGFVPRIVWAIVMLRGQYWMPPLLGIYGIYKAVIGIMALTNKIDIVEGNRLPLR